MSRWTHATFVLLTVYSFLDSANIVSESDIMWLFALIPPVESLLFSVWLTHSDWLIYSIDTRAVWALAGGEGRRLWVWRQLKEVDNYYSPSTVLSSQRHAFQRLRAATKLLIWYRECVYSHTINDVRQHRAHLPAGSSINRASQQWVNLRLFHHKNTFASFMWLNVILLKVPFEFRFMLWCNRFCSVSSRKKNSWIDFCSFARLIT